MDDAAHTAGPGCPVDAASVGCRFQQVARAHRAVLASELEAVGLYAGQENALSVLWEHGPLTQTKLAALVGVDTSTMCRTLQRLERAGFVSRATSDTDRRTTLVRPTRAGNRLRDGLSAVFARTEERLVSGLEPGERVELARLLQKVLDSLHP